MRVLFAVLSAVPAFALSNAVTLQERSGSTQTNRVITIPRYFANKEICLNPRPYSSGSAMTYWQSDVKTRWPADGACAGGYVKLALITVEIPSVSGNGTYTIEFRSDVASSSAGSGLTKTQMLAFNAGGGAPSWGAKITAGVSTLSSSVSARDMITNDHYQIIESGPLRTSILVREGPDSVAGGTTRTTSIGFQCDTNCVAPYDTATWEDTNANYHSMRPSFVVTFYSPHTGAGSVEVDYLLDNGWYDRGQDQRLESFVLYNGGAETTACYTAPAPFVIPFRSRAFETCWSTAPAAMNIDFNRAYVMYSKLLPAIGLNWTVGEAAIQLEIGAGTSTTCISGTCSFASSDLGATTNTTIAPHMGWAQDKDIGGPAGGTSPIIGILDRWTARYVTTFDPRLLTVVLGNAKAGMHAPIYGLESSTTAVFHTGDTALAFGRPVSIDVRPNLNTHNGSGATAAEAPHSPHGDVICSTSGNNSGCPTGASTCTAPNCMVTCTGSAQGSAVLSYCSVFTASANTVNKWGNDLAHAREWFIGAYLFTGKWVYLESQWHHGAWELLATVQGNWPPTAIYTRGGKRGIVYEGSNSVRSTAWPMRDWGGAALMSPDRSVEQKYFLEKLNNNVENFEGGYGVTNGFTAQGAFTTPPSSFNCTGFDKNTETSIWRMARCYNESGWSNPLGAVYQNKPSTPMLGSGLDPRYTSDGVKSWMEGYWTTVLAVLRDWGFKTDYLHEIMAKRFMSLFMDSGFRQKVGGNPVSPADAVHYQIASMSGTAVGGHTGYLQTWSAVRAAHIDSAILARDVNSSDTTLYTNEFYSSAENSVFDFNLKGGTYFKIDNEIFRIDSDETASITDYAKTVTAVDTVANTMTAVAHGFNDGDMVTVTMGNTAVGGLSSNPACRHAPSASWPYVCSVWAHVIDANTLQFYNDSALTSLIALTSPATGVVVHQGKWLLVPGSGTPGQRGALGTTATSHSRGATVYYWPIIVPPSRVTNPDSHGMFYTSSLAGAVDHDLTVTDSLTGATYSARRAWEIAVSTIYNQEMAGINSPACSGKTIVNCDAPTWGIHPRPLIRNVRVVPGTTDARLYYTAPDGNACKVGVSTSAFTTTDDAGDTSDAQNNPARMFMAAALSSATTYYYRITCGPMGGAGRVSGTFVMP